MTQPTHIWCLHGNLQRASVWRQFDTSFPLPLEPVDVFETDPSEMTAWVEQFCEHVARRSLGHKQILIGYSLGGRLALQSLIKAPALWAGAVIISADPGAYSPETKDKQVLFDQQWGARFLHEDWESLLAEWNAQTVFCGRDNPVPLSEDAFDRERIAMCFDRFSKGRQADLSLALQAVPEPPVLFVSGECDTKYGEIGDRLEAQCPCVTHRCIRGAGHRVPWEAPRKFTQVVGEFLDSLAVC